MDNSQKIWLRGHRGDGAVLQIELFTEHCILCNRQTGRNRRPLYRVTVHWVCHWRSGTVWINAEGQNGDFPRKSEKKWSVAHLLWVLIRGPAVSSLHGFDNILMSQTCKKSHKGAAISITLAGIRHRKVNGLCAEPFLLNHIPRLSDF